MKSTAIAIITVVAVLAALAATAAQAKGGPYSIQVSGARLDHNVTIPGPLGERDMFPDGAPATVDVSTVAPGDTYTLAFFARDRGASQETLFFKLQYYPGEGARPPAILEAGRPAIQASPALVQVLADSGIPVAAPVAGGAIGAGAAFPWLIVALAAAAGCVVLITAAGRRYFLRTTA